MCVKHLSIPALHSCPSIPNALKFLHLIDDMVEFGPANCFCTERYTLSFTIIMHYLNHRFEAYNATIRAQNVYGNKQAPSKDIASKFASIGQLKFLCSGGYIDEKGQTIRYVKYDTVHVHVRGVYACTCNI